MLVKLTGLVPVPVLVGATDDRAASVDDGIISSGTLADSELDIAGWSSPGKVGRGLLAESLVAAT